MAQITRVTSEALQATIRRLLPSQQGFGEDLEAQNVIVPVIDLTPTAEGSQLDTDLARALESACTEFDVTNATTALTSVSGFYRVNMTVTATNAGPDGGIASIQMSSTGPTTDVVKLRTNSTGADQFTVNTYDVIVFVATGETVSIACNAAARATGSFRQVADSNGNTVNPSGFSFE